MEEDRDDELEELARAALADESLDPAAKVVLLEKMRALAKARGRELEEEYEWENEPRTAVSMHSTRRRQEREEQKRDAVAVSLSPERPRTHRLASRSPGPKSPLEGATQKSENDSSDPVADNVALDEDAFLRRNRNAAARRDAKAERFLWIQSATQLAHRAQVLQREVRAGLRTGRALDDGTSRALEKFDKEMERVFHNDRADLQKRMDKSQFAVSLLSAHVDKMGAGEHFVNTLRRLMEDAEGEIATLKAEEHRSYEDLAKDEWLMTREIEQLAQRFRSMEEEDKLGKRARRQAARQNTQLQNRTGAGTLKGSIPGEQSGGLRGTRRQRVEHHSVGGANGDSHPGDVAAIDEEIADEGGSTGNWDSRDHAQFLRLVSRFKIRDSLLRQLAIGCGGDSPAVQAVVEKAALEIPTQDARGVMEHLEWYGRYTALLERKKEAVKAWRAQRNCARTKPGSEGSSLAVKGSSGVEGARAQSSKQSKARDDRRKREAAEKRRAVEQWKREKAEQARLEGEREARVKQEERERRDREATRRQREKEKLSVFKLARDAENVRRKQPVSSRV